MSLPFSIKHPRLRAITLDSNKNTNGPTTRKMWLILGASVYHINLTESEFYIEEKGSPGFTIHHLSFIPAASATDWYPLFNMSNSLLVGQFPIMLLNDAMQISVAGGTGYSFLFSILEFDEVLE